MRQRILNREIPSVIGLLIILVGIVFTTILVKTGTVFFGQASPSHTPKNITITNVTDTSFTVSYLTDDAVIGTISYGEDKSTSKTALDDRDELSGKVASHKIHNFSLNNLKPETPYFFYIMSKDEKFLNNGSLFTTKTGKQIDQSPSNLEPIAGKIILPNGNAPSEGIVYFGVSGAQNFSALLKSDGSYIIPLNSVRSADLSSYFDFGNGSIIKILAIGDSLESKATLSSNQTSPAPTITLSNNYDFTSQESLLNASPSGNFPTFDSIQEGIPASASASIINPKSNANLSDQQPTFQGTAVPEETVDITIQSDPIKASVKSDSKGNWSYRPTSKLSPGEHTITIVTKNSSGIIQTIKRSFTVYASGEQVTQSATPSATTKPSPSPSASPTPSATPSVSLSPTPTPALSPSPSASVAPLPPTGSNSTPILILFGLVIAFIGGSFFFVSRRVNS